MPLDYTRLKDCKPENENQIWFPVEGDLTIEASNHKNQSCYLFYRSCRKLTQSSRCLIIILAVLCLVHETEELSVKWYLQNPVDVGKTAILNCTIDEKSNVCQNINFIWRWTKYSNQSILIFNGISSNKSKYTEEHNENCTESSLHIHNFDQSDLAMYTCSCGFHQHSKEFNLEGFCEAGNKENISVHAIFTCSHFHLTLEIEMRKIFPAPMCYSIIENGRLKHKRIRTNLSEALYTTEDTLKFVFKDHSCSGTIHSFCRFKNKEKEVFTRTYDCCPDHHNSVVKTVAIGFAIVITFVVIICFVYLFRRKIKDCTRDCFHKQEGFNYSPVVPLQVQD
ncbi:uncharacterized protein LOC127712619 isoform X5 [Mytilus californianus]|uniref:uncharacterized protein LOC127712619 isoform X5 n=1 Tax=Mytilus californianus TaxID=6549 RepID=UPI0022475F85|nr:uncharacterized protein LOC127712619 isoform X5 [Mytilus californianus]XP_052075133.1 uncharacterized protein LOC127712619 isoform X5 [Mytilus californianus]XP_052075134.1 uncharacterized protein LOC127712619 isoform X5 [Mytilus californianus]